ncbi:hypothetical protein [Burkholderia vietnamiensis]|uniref:hypothetical protein n=1 Tax=Burkholderia vietnamiensis TaxID=60552 RepID=UPI001BA1A80D|nr:hypothetical protein [Burkholderia vietnamiensis]MBR7999234.1 hypothetical protein [Burkholderia vietnamiensis]MDN7814656.1 hypothetical protein [Burkholderia vietnamiensis]
MSDLAAAAPGSTEPAVPMTDAERAALPDWVKNGQPPAQEGGAAALGESTATAPDAAQASAISPAEIAGASGASISTADNAPAVAVAGEIGAAAAAAAPSDISATTSADAAVSAAILGAGEAGAGFDGGNAPAVVQEGTSTADSINLGAHLSRLDGMLAEIERKIAAGIHTFAHEITAARDHLAKLL